MIHLEPNKVQFGLSVLIRWLVYPLCLIRAILLRLEDNYFLYFFRNDENNYTFSVDVKKIWIIYILTMLSFTFRNIKVFGIVCIIDWSKWVSNIIKRKYLHEIKEMFKDVLLRLSIKIYVIKISWHDWIELT